ncbi:MAG: DHH family phosphoesterase [Candidatus Heimdallarchaeota archaeon]|nr:MAG: DHH family phosphoesterase [Candidatus Heimdallarchaeota archaeon]
MRSIPQFEHFVTFLRNIQGTVVLIMHSQADPDAVGSAIAMTHFIQAINPNLSISTLEPDVSRLGQKLLDMTDFQFSFVNINEVKPPCLCILVDTSAINQEFISPENQFVILDHHHLVKLEVELAFDFRFDSFRATAEIVTCLYYQAKIPLKLPVVKALLAGIIFDTRRFLYADRELFECIDFLLSEYPNAYPEVINYFSSKRSSSEKMACIKAAQRMKKFQIGDKILLFSHISSFEAAAARALITLGGDVGVVIANRKNETRISFRTTPDFPMETGISLAKDIIPALIDHFGGTGGGHDGAAGYNSKELEINSVKSFIFQLFKNIFEKKNVKWASTE